MRRRQVFAQKKLENKLKNVEMMNIPKPKKKGGRPPGRKSYAYVGVPEKQDSNGPSQD